MHRVNSACSTPSFDPNRLKTVARDTPAAAASYLRAEEWKNHDGFLAAGTDAYC